MFNQLIEYSFPSLIKTHSLSGSLKVRTSDSVNPLPTIIGFNNTGKEAFEDIVGKGENASNQNFLLFPQWFLSYWVMYYLLSANAFDLDRSKSFVVK